MKKVVGSVIACMFCLVAVGLMGAFAPAWIVPVALCIFMVSELCRSIYVFLIQRKDLEGFSANACSMMFTVTAIAVAVTMGMLIRVWWMLTFWY